MIELCITWLGRTDESRGDIDQDLKAEYNLVGISEEQVDTLFPCSDDDG